MPRRFGMATGAFEDIRGDWSAGVGRASAGMWPYLELTTIAEPELDALIAFLMENPGALLPFARVTVHAPVRLYTSPSTALTKLPGGLEAVLHPDVYPDASSLGERAVFENMDVAKPFGQTPAELASVFERHPDAGFCLDVAHVLTNDPSLALGHELLDSFGDRLRQLHLSGIAPDGTHQRTTAADLRLYEPLLARCEHVPWLLETELA
jgi:hypothetical protein